MNGNERHTLAKAEAFLEDVAWLQSFGTRESLMAEYLGFRTHQAYTRRLLRAKTTISKYQDERAQA